MSNQVSVGAECASEEAQHWRSDPKSTSRCSRIAALFPALFLAVLSVAVLARRCLSSCPLVLGAAQSVPL